MQVAIAGNPNAGKTTLFNALTGSRAKVGNYPGITVESRHGDAALPDGSACRIVDLPGCYSLTARSPEEDIAHRVLCGDLGDPPPDVTVCVVDAMHLSRGMYLLLQLTELGRPVVLALNMMDAVHKVGMDVDAAALETRVGLPVIPMSARTGDGIPALMKAIASAAESPKTPPSPMDARAETALAGMRHDLRASGMAPEQAPWVATSNISRTGLDPATRATLSRVKQTHDTEGTLGRTLIDARYRHIDALLGGIVQAAPHGATVTERVDAWVLHPIAGPTLFAATMFILFQAVFAWATPLMSGIEVVMGAAAEGITQIMPESLTRSMLVDGLLAGVGNVLIFLPQIALLFLGLTLLEESGYLARAAFLMDGLMRRVGLQGKAFIPLLGSFACAIPGIMAARTIESRRDRLVTIFVAPLMSCAARLPVYVLVIAALFSHHPPLLGLLSVGGLIITGMYFLGFALAIVIAWVMKRTVLRGEAQPFVLEMPSYRRPAVKTVALRVWDRCKVFVTQTGRVIITLSVLLWGLMTFPQTDPATLATLEPSEQATVQLEQSIAGQIGLAIEPAIAPLGFDWRIGVSLVASFAAREVLVSTLGQLYALGGDVDADAPSLRQALLSDRDPDTGLPTFTPLVGMSLMVFFVIALQCLSTVAVVARETGGWQWPIAQLVTMNGLAYLSSLLVFQVGTLLGF